MWHRTIFQDYQDVVFNNVQHITCLWWRIHIIVVGVWSVVWISNETALKMQDPTTLSSCFGIYISWRLFKSLPSSVWPSVTECNFHGRVVWSEWGNEDIPSPIPQEEEDCERLRDQRAIGIHSSSCTSSKSSWKRQNTRRRKNQWESEKQQTHIRYC